MPTWDEVIKLLKSILARHDSHDGEFKKILHELHEIREELAVIRKRLPESGTIVPGDPVP